MVRSSPHSSNSKSEGIMIKFVSREPKPNSAAHGTRFHRPAQKGKHKRPAETDRKPNTNYETTSAIYKQQQQLANPSNKTRNSKRTQLKRLIQILVSITLILTPLIHLIQHVAEFRVLAAQAARNSAQPASESQIITPIFTGQSARANSQQHQLLIESRHLRVARVTAADGRPSTNSDGPRPQASSQNSSDQVRQLYPGYQAAPSTRPRAQWSQLRSTTHPPQTQAQAQQEAANATNRVEAKSEANDSAKLSERHLEDPDEKQRPPEEARSFVGGWTTYNDEPASNQSSSGAALEVDSSATTHNHRPAHLKPPSNQAPSSAFASKEQLSFRYSDAILAEGPGSHSRPPPPAPLHQQLVPRMRRPLVTRYQAAPSLPSRSSHQPTRPLTMSPNQRPPAWRQGRVKWARSNIYKRVLLCDKTLVSLDYLRSEVPPISTDSDFAGDWELNYNSIEFDAGSFVDDFFKQDQAQAQARNAHSYANNNSNSNNSNSNLNSHHHHNNNSNYSTTSANNNNNKFQLLDYQQQPSGSQSSYSSAGWPNFDPQQSGKATEWLLPDDDPLVLCDMWDLEKGLLNRKPPESLLAMAIKADFNTVREAIKRCRQLSERAIPAMRVPDDEYRDGGVGIGTVEIRPEDMVSMFSIKRGLIPGTKWCGLGDIAATYNDLGSKRRIDICCRAHDHCPIRLKPFRNDYGLLNIALYTKSHCECDADFYRCLREVRSRTADMLGNLYFNVMKLQCLKQEPMQLCREIRLVGFSKQNTSHSAHFPLVIVL